VFASIACISLISAIAVIVLNYKKLVAYDSVKIKNKIQNLDFATIEYSVTANELIEKLKSMDIHIFDIELTKGINPTATELSAILDIKLPAKMKHTKVMTAIAEIKTVKSVEEL
jgi:uncharacterized membrane protein YhiD involved in acid resistance